MAGYATGIDVKLGLNAAAFTAALDATKARVYAFSAATKGAAGAIQSHMTEAFKRLGSVAGKALTEIREKLNLIAKWGAIAGAALGGLLLKNMSQLASNAEETAAKFGTVFRGVEAEANAAVERFRKLGLGITEARGAMAQLQDTFVPFGFARDDAEKLSEAVTQLGVDLGSFNNIRADESINLLTSALIGNHEAVRRFGILITQTTLDEELLRLGFAKSTQGATEQQKVIARLSLMFKSSGDAMGDLERTNDSFANTMRRLRSRFTEFLESAGKDFNVWLLRSIDDMGGVEGVVETFKRALESLKGTFRVVGDAVKDFFKKLADGRGEVGWLVTAFRALNVAGQGVHVTFRGAIALFDDSATAQQHFADALYESQKALDSLRGSESEYVKVENQRRAAEEQLAKLLENKTEKQEKESDAARRASDLIGVMAEKLKGLTGEAGASADGLAKIKKGLEDLAELREKTATDFETRGFEIGFSGLTTQDQQLAALGQRAEEFRNKADLAKMRGDLEGARNALIQFADLVERINSTEGGMNSAFRAQELQDVAANIDALFAKQISEQEQLQQQMTRIADEAQRFAAAMESAAASTTNAVNSLAGATIQQEGMAAGGRVTDPRDTIPALLRSGETVITPEQSRMLAPLLRRVGVPGFASGGNAAFNDMLRGSRLYTQAGMAAQISDARQVSSYRSQQLKALIEQVGFHRASELMILQRQSGIPIMPPGFQESASAFGLGPRGYARGGSVGGSSQSFDFSGMNVNYNSYGGGSATDAVGIATKIQRAVARNMARVN